MIYLIDTNAIIQLFKTYSPQYFPHAWDELDILVSNNSFFSTIANYEELAVKDDDCFNFWKNRYRNIFIETDLSTQEKVIEIVNKFPDLIEEGSEREEADPYLIATAIVMQGTVITEERLLLSAAVNNPKRKQKMRIPNVCDHYGVPWMGAIPFMNSSDWR